MNKMKWTTVKPLADKEKVFISAYNYKGQWEYKLWEIKKIDSVEGWYYGLCEADGEEWGPYEDLDSQMYLVIPSADAVDTDNRSVATKVEKPY